MTYAIDIWSYSILLLFFGVFAGYCAGRRNGLREGMERGLQVAPLEMLQSSWAKGVCALCGATATGGKAEEVEANTDNVADGANAPDSPVNGED